MATAKSTSPKAIEINAETGEVIEREMTADELAELAALPIIVPVEERTK